MLQNSVVHVVLQHFFYMMNYNLYIPIYIIVNFASVKDI